MASAGKITADKSNLSFFRSQILVGQLAFLSAGGTGVQSWAGYKISSLLPPCSRNSSCDPLLGSGDMLIKLWTREVDGHFSFAGNSNFGGCILTGILHTLLLVTRHRSCFVCLYGSSVKLLVLLNQNASILFIVTSYRSETQK